ncbi:N/A [soil metagenome]
MEIHLLELAAGIAIGTAGALLLLRGGKAQPATDSESEDARLAAVLNAMPEGVALIDANNVALFCNPAITEMLGATQGAVIGSDAIAPESRGEFDRALSVVRDTQRASTAEVRLTTAPPRDVLLSFLPHDGAIIMTALDVTAGKKSEQLRTEFVANVSHELRTPLAAIRGYVETCLEPPGSGEAPPYDRFLPIVHQHALRLNELIEDLLTLSRIESKGMQFRFGPQHLSEVAAGVITTLLQDAEKKRIALINEIPETLPEVTADLSALERILLNLMENAIKYSEDGGQVRIAAQPRGAMLCISVNDAGVGIAKEDQARVFERFYRVDKARSRKAGGTGLGLSIVKHLVQSHGGEVWVESEPGKGSTFYFTLPMAR